MLTVKPTMESIFPSHLFQIPINRFQNIVIQLNENPMYIEKDETRQLEEPMYQVVIRVPSTGDLLYEYFDSPTVEDAISYIQQLVAEYHRRGCQWVFFSHGLGERNGRYN